MSRRRAFLQISFNLLVNLFDFLTRLLTYMFLKWQLVVGKKYEVVVTNKDGLWRYQLNDIVEVAGFTPEEGIPLLRFIERKGCAEDFIVVRLWF